MNKKITEIKAVIDKIFDKGLEYINFMNKLENKGIDIKEIKNMRFTTYIQDNYDNGHKEQDTILAIKTNERMSEEFGYGYVQYEINVMTDKIEGSIFSLKRWTNININGLKKITKVAEFIEAVYQYAKENTEQVNENKIAELNDELFTKYGLTSNENEQKKRIFIGNRWHIVSIDRSDLYKNRTEITDYIVEKTNDTINKKSMDEINVIIENINNTLKKINAE